MRKLPGGPEAGGEGTSDKTGPGKSAPGLGAKQKIRKEKKVGGQGQGCAKRAGSNTKLPSPKRTIQKEKGPFGGKTSGTEKEGRRGKGGESRLGHGSTTSSGTLGGMPGA